MNKDSNIMIFGAGMVGGGVIRCLEGKGFTNVVSVTRRQCDMTRQSEVEDFMQANKADYVVVTAAKVGGILANSTYPADFLYENLMIESNIIHSAYLNGVKKLLFLGSTCIYPKLAEQPLKEESLLSSALEPTNEAYAIAKIAGLKMCDYYSKQYGCNFIGAMPTNLYGVGDNFHAENSHVIPGLIGRFHQAKVNGDEKVVCWGSGSPLREFLYIDDLAEAIVFLLGNFDGPGFVNVGSGVEHSIKELAELVAKAVGFEGEIEWDSSKPDGTPRKVCDMSKLHGMGWKHNINLEDGLKMTYEWFLGHLDEIRK